MFAFFNLSPLQPNSATDFAWLDFIQLVLLCPVAAAAAERNAI
jgi:hypothetical protein